MSQADVSSALDHAIDSGAQLVVAKAPAGPPLPEQTITFVRGEVAIASLIEALESYPQLSIYQSAWLGNRVSGGSTINYRNVAEWMLRERLTGRASESITNRVFTFSDERTAECWQVLLINGFKVEAEVELSDGYFLLPLESIQDAFAKNWIATGFTQFQPHCCIVKRFKSISIRGTTETPDVQSPALEYHSTLNEVRRALSLIGPCAPIVVGQTGFLVDAPGSGLGGGAASSIHEVNTTAEEPHLLNSSDAQDIVRQYLGLAPPSRAKLHTGIDRLGLALRRLQLSDRAIELGIALESLLLPDSNARDQIALPLRLRGAWLTSANLLERIERERLLSKVYTLRSKAVHSGTLSGEKNSEMIIDSGCELCALVARKLIERKCSVNWTGLILGDTDQSTRT